MLSFMALIVVQSSQLGPITYTQLILNVAYILIYTLCRPSTYIMVSILHRCISSLVSRWLPNSLRLRQQLGLISQMSRPMVCATVIFCFCSLYCYLQVGTKI